ncbi:myelin expression factor 2-like [Bacillus rossius redtenbacheri]|uniref:myelin expression factor 2-like n=1 Tax=Bacillus rossius redtenbacheri TaxID=93214 RepID=UPI002FDEA1AA
MDDKADYDDKSRSPMDDNSRERDRDRTYRGERTSRFSNVSRDKDRDRSDRGASAAERRVFVSNIPYEFRWQELKDLFRNEVGEVAYVELFYDEDNKPRGCGIVEFDSVDSVSRAVEKMHRYELRERKLVVKEDFDTVRDKCGRPVKFGGGGGGGGGGGNPNRGNRDDQRRAWDPPQQNQMVGGGQQKWGNTYGLSPQFLESLWINPPLVARVFVANLDYKVDSQKLTEVFKLAGKVQSAEVSMDKEGKSRGFGVVEYDHPVEAVQAISMLNNQMLYDRRLAVRMDRADNKPDGPPKLPEGLRGVGMGLGAGGNPLRDVARNLPNLTQGPGASLAGGSMGLGAGLTNLAGLSNAASLGLAGISGLNAASLLQANLAGAGDLATLANASALAGGLGGGVGVLGVANSPFGAGVGANAFGVGVGATPNSATFLGASGGGQGPASGYGSNTGPSQAFDNISSGIGNTGGGGGGGFGGGAQERGGGQGGGNMGSNYANGPMGGGGSNVTRSDTVLVRNIPQSVTWQMLRDKFMEIGDVKFAELRGKDMGLVRFNSEWDAERAVHMMDRSRYEGRSIEVCLY